MSEWQEDNFLERLAHDSKEDAVPMLCPEVEALYVGSDSGGVGPISAQLHQHIEHCPLCLDLQRRLDLFDRATPCSGFRCYRGRETSRFLVERFSGFGVFESARPDFGTHAKRSGLPSAFENANVLDGELGGKYGGNDSCRGRSGLLPPFIEHPNSRAGGGAHHTRQPADSR